jgi:hypothetical protein
MAVGLALLRLERAIRAVARRFGLTLEDLKLDLGPLGRRCSASRPTALKLQLLLLGL